MPVKGFRNTLYDEQSHAKMEAAVRSAISPNTAGLVRKALITSRDVPRFPSNVSSRRRRVSIHPNTRTSKTMATKALTESLSASDPASTTKMLIVARVSSQRKVPRHRYARAISRLGRVEFSELQGCVVDRRGALGD
jgi:hypothetical protein